jgi:hypothetical protein
MNEQTLFVKVGRAAPKPLCSSESSAVLDAVEQKTLHDLVGGGNDIARVVFTREKVVGVTKGNK